MVPMMVAGVEIPRDNKVSHQNTRRKIDDISALMDHKRNNLFNFLGQDVVPDERIWACYIPNSRYCSVLVYNFKG